MAKIAASKARFEFNSVQLQDELTSISQDVNVELPVVTALGDTGPRRVEGNYDFSYALEGTADFSSGQGDATIFGRIGNGGSAGAFDPTGKDAAANDPNYDSTSLLVGSYSVRASVGQPITYTANLFGDSALSRATS